MRSEHDTAQALSWQSRLLLRAMSAVIAGSIGFLVSYLGLELQGRILGVPWFNDPTYSKGVSRYWGRARTYCFFPAEASELAVASCIRRAVDSRSRGSGFLARYSWQQMDDLHRPHVVGDCLRGDDITATSRRLKALL